ncbi:MAG: hypothetical protein ACRDRL_27410 [Sciscionella sp.]
MTAVEVNAVTNDPHVKQWREQARWSLLRARQLQDAGDKVSTSIVLARGETRHAASEMLRTAEAVAAAAKKMLDTAWRLRQSDASWSDPDGSCLRYVRARTWQDCAHQLDPTLPEIQPRWD